MSQPERRVEVLFPADAIAARVEELAQEITVSLGRDVHLISVLKGSFIFAADLVRALHRAGMRPRIDFLALSSYGADEQSSGTVKMLGNIVDNLAGRTVLLIDDIWQSGRTLTFARDLLQARGVRAVKCCVLLLKAQPDSNPDIGFRPGSNPDAGFRPDFSGFSCPDRFVVGYGLDYAHDYRDLPYIGALLD
jgi:hypoxanthine phosphoribosyltransferase